MFPTSLSSIYKSRLIATRRGKMDSGKMSSSWQTLGFKKPSLSTTITENNSEKIRCSDCWTRAFHPRRMHSRKGSSRNLAGRLRRPGSDNRHQTKVNRLPVFCQSIHRIHIILENEVLKRDLVVRSSTAEESVIDIVETVNSPRRRAGADDAISLFRT